MSLSLTAVDLGSLHSIHRLPAQPGLGYTPGFEPFFYETIINRSLLSRDLQASDTCEGGKLRVK
jgi:hypothetical protein